VRCVPTEHSARVHVLRCRRLITAGSWGTYVTRVPFRRVSYSSTRRRWASLAAAVAARSATESDSRPRPAPFSSRVPARPRPLGRLSSVRVGFRLVFFFFLLSPLLPSFSITRKTGMRVHNDRIMWPRLPGHHNNIIIIIIIISRIFPRRPES